MGKLEIPFWLVEKNPHVKYAHHVQVTYTEICDAAQYANGAEKLAEIGFITGDENDYFQIVSAEYPNGVRYVWALDVAVVW